MKLGRFDMRLLTLPAVILLTALAAGCARTPADGGLARVRSVTVELAFAAPVNEDMYYFAVIDAEGGGPGPIPVFPGITPGQGWVTGAATHFVEYHQGRFTIYKFLDFNQFQYVQIGTPIRFNAGAQSLSFTVDLNDLAITGESLDINFITLDRPFEERRTIDALFHGGASALNLDISRDNTTNNAQVGFIEQPDDLRNENATPVPTTDLTRPLDMTGWSIAVDI